MSDLKKRARLLLAEGYLRIGELEKGQKIFIEEHGDVPPDLLICCGENCKDREKALEAFTAASALGKLEALGDACMEEENFSVASRAYAVAHAIEKLTALGDKMLKGKTKKEEVYLVIRIAMLAFTTAKDEKRLIALGAYCLKQADHEREAIAAFSAAGAVEQLIRAGDLMLENCSKKYVLLNRAASAYEAAKAHDKLLACAEKYLECSSFAGNAVDDALSIYKKNRRPPSH